MNKFHFVIDKINIKKKLKNNFLNKYKNYKPKQSNIIIVMGGDGFMLQTLKKYQKYNKPFYGINRGTYGFLMNRFKTFDLDDAISSIKIKTKGNKSFSSIAINEISLLRQSRQTASLQIIVGKKILIKKLISDGVLISTPAGSTAYNMSVGGPILSLDSKKLAVTPISPFRPRRWKGKIVPASAKIVIKNLNIKKRSVSVVSDNIEVRNISSVKISISKKIKFKLLYDKKNSLLKKIKQEQNRYRSKI